ncbi:hypothetical protein [Thermostaphylospora chromogena]|uniref:hypothetical protein n=1 Tax=Thermostaphylospora chromogena TaxID=35622 RepID=UPI0013F5CD47|nr:hypothetical protein [Thermostaphylospora chromogena]
MFIAPSATGIVEGSRDRGVRWVRSREGVEEGADGGAVVVLPPGDGRIVRGDLQYAD